MTTGSKTLQIASAGLTASISTVGAELQTLVDAQGRSLLWRGDPAVWSGRAPILFPVVGCLEGGRYRLAGHSYAMPKHGFARHASFDVVSQEAHETTLRLTPSDATREVYPFAFELDVAFALDGATLRIAATIRNRDTKPMPASLGFHPAFRWPLPYDQPRADHFIRFEHAEAAPIRRIDGNGLLTPTSHPTPVTGDVLALRDALFDDDALIFDRLTSRRLTYGASQGPRLAIAFDDFPVLGVWTKPNGAGFICIEPWQGVADPVGYDGTIWDKPGIIAIEGGGSRAFTMAIAVTDPLDAEPSRAPIRPRRRAQTSRAGPDPRATSASGTHRASPRAGPVG